MLVKEYRICLPLSVEEYRIAQLYMIQKKSREESSGSGSGVEIRINEPYTNGPGGNGQYTHKIYHIGSHLPGWFRAILPKSALQVEEEAWNAYPYTKTIYRCPFIEKFSLEIETVYINDAGLQENIFKLSAADINNRTVDYLDIVKDQISSGDYRREEDPKLFKSEKTGRGPLTENWREEYGAAVRDPPAEGQAIMTAYKLCKVEFRYWGMQSKIERFIHDIGLRKTMLRAHRQAWCWQDEYYGLTMADIRRLERETQLALQETMAPTEEEQEEQNNANNQLATAVSKKSMKAARLPEEDREDMSHGGGGQNAHISNSTATGRQQQDELGGGHHQRMGSVPSVSSLGSGRRNSWNSARSRLSGSPHKIAEWGNVGSIEQLQNSSDDEFFDAQEDFSEPKGNASLMRTSSMEMLTPEDEYQDAIPPPSTVGYYSKEELVGSPLDRRMEQYRQLHQTGGSHSLDMATPYSSTIPSGQSNCKTTILFLVLHGGSIMDSGHEHHLSKHADISTLKATLDSTVEAHYPAVQGHIAVRVIPCPAVCREALSLLSSINPYSFDVQSPSADTNVVSHENFPLSVIPLFATGSPPYVDAVAKVVSKSNAAYNDFLRSEEGLGFNGQVCLIADSVGSILAYDALCKNNPYLCSHDNSHHGSQGSLPEMDENGHESAATKRSNLETIKQVSISNPDLTVTDTSVDCGGSDGNGGVDNTVVNGDGEVYTSSSASSSKNKHFVRHASCPTSRRTSTGSQGEVGKLDFEVTDFFMFGSPLGMVLAYRKMCQAEDRNIPTTPQFLDPLAAVLGYQFNAAARSRLDSASDNGRLSLLVDDPGAVPQTSKDAVPRPSCHQIYNLFYPSDPTAVRMEPILHERFKHVPPFNIPRYQKFPLGDGQSVHVVETIQSQGAILMDPPSSYSQDAPLLERRQSNMSIMSQASGYGELTSNITSITSRWWGNKRLDYALYYPDALQSFPSTALPYLLHASFWESSDVVAFILRQVVRQEFLSTQADLQRENMPFKPSQPREKWLKRRTTIKLRNVAPNHRANDVIVLEDRPQTLTARFMYGPLDVVSLTGEKVDIHILTDPPTGDWVYYSTEVSDSNGRLTHNIPADMRLPQGMYPVKMVVRGDHTCVDFYLTVLPPKAETVIFSIDGSFTASMSIMGKDPKVRAGAVDVVRHWQELGYLILYISARPDMQQKKVVAWLAQHNFPHGMVAFMDGLSADPLRQKSNFLKQLVQEAQIQIHAAYGSSKDIAVYHSVNLAANNIFIVGKPSKKNQKEAVIISEGYAAHLNNLTSQGGSRLATGNARMFLRKSCFSLPGQGKPGSKKQVHKCKSLPQRASSVRETSRGGGGRASIGVSQSGITVVEGGQPGSGMAVRARGVSPRVKLSPSPYDSS